MTRRNIVFLILALVLLAFGAFALAARGFKRQMQSANCGNQMSSIGLGAMMWANDHKGRTAADFVSMSNELTTPKILICPSDTMRRRATNWDSFAPTNCT